MLLLVSCGSDVSTPVTSTLAPSPSPITYVVSGRVQSADGLPLQGAHVFVGGDAFTSRQGSPAFDTSTDDAGMFSGSLPAGVYIAEARHPGYETVTTMSVQVSRPTVVNFTLHLGIMLGGRVMVAGGGPAPFNVLNDVLVELTSGPNKGLSALTGHPVPGVYGMEHVLPGDFTIRASKAGYDSVEQTVHAVDDISDLDFTLTATP
jgi:hypothetical protein